MLGRIPSMTSIDRLKSEFSASGFCAIGVGHVAAACNTNGSMICCPRAIEPAPRVTFLIEPLSRTVGELQGARTVAFAITCSDVIAVRLAPVPSRSPIRFFMARCASGDLLSSCATGVGHGAATIAASSFKSLPPCLVP